jgi:hypothetical protein
MLLYQLINVAWISFIRFDYVSRALLKADAYFARLPQKMTNQKEAPHKSSACVLVESRQVIGESALSDAAEPTAPLMKGTSAT